MTVNLKLLRLFLIHDVLPISRFLFNFRLGFFKHSTIFCVVLLFHYSQSERDGEQNVEDPQV